MNQRSRHDEAETSPPNSALDKTQPNSHNEAKLPTISGFSLGAVPLPHKLLVVGLICIAQFTTQLEFGQVLIVTHVIGERFGIQDPGIFFPWFMVGYSLTVGTFILFSGRLGDLLGWKRMMVNGQVWAAVWTLVLGLSGYSSYVMFIFTRVMHGIALSICLPNGLALLGALYIPGKRKNMAFAAFGVRVFHE
jgi:MFS family permease